jgi:hypothetical protein
MATLTPLIVSLFLLLSTIPAHSRVFNIPSGDVTALINAINRANSNGEENTINLEPGTYSLIAVDNGSGPDANGLPVITGVIGIIGSGAQTTILKRSLPLSPPVPRFRIFDIAADGRLTINQVTVSGGAINGDGGGIRNAGNLTINNSIVENNFAVRGSGFLSGSGGGILSLGTVTIINSTIADNHSDSETGQGGGLANLGTIAVVQKSAITQNTAASGGGLSNRTISGLSKAATMDVLDSTVENNIGGFGAGIANAAALRIVNSTVSDNNSRPPALTTTERGGGIFSSDLATTEIKNSIVAGNTLTILPVFSGLGPDCFGPITSLGYNIIGDPSDCSISLLTSDLTGDPGLDAFTDDGTPGNGHFPLLETSPAIDKGNNDVCLSNPILTTDQIGDPRVGVCDIGAIEFEPVPVLTVVLSVRPSSAENRINLKSNGLVRVAILSTADFDAGSIIRASLKFGPGQALAQGKGQLKDVNGDGQADLVLHFRTQDSGIQCGDTSVLITGQTLNGNPIKGSDSITTVGCESGSENKKNH